LISSLGLSAHVRHIDFAPIEDFNGYIGACDAILNLRYPTVGESSGTLLRAFGMGKAVLVSEIGSFREYPDSICLKVPVNESEEDVIYAYMDMLATRPEFAQALGERARNWVGQECNWDLVARKYAEFAVQVANGSAASASVDPVPADEKETLEIDKPVPEAVSVPGEYIEQWVPQENGAREYVGQHLTRFEKTLSITPPGDANQSILEMGAYLHITPSLHTKLGYGEVRGCYFGAAGRTERKEVVSESGERFECMVDLFNAEQDRFPYEDGRFNTVLCCELIEHLPTDPMFMMSELNRVIRPGGHLVLTTPNIASVRALAGILQGFHPMLFPAYVRPRESGGVEARHAREYTAPEIRLMLQDAGFEVTLLETGPFREEPKPEFAWVEHLLDRYILTKEHRGDGIYAVGRKVGPVKDRWPAWLYV
jgi:SAM-dependent methyltransferase